MYSTYAVPKFIHTAILGAVVTIISLILKMRKKVIQVDEGWEVLQLESRI